MKRKRNSFKKRAIDIWSRYKKLSPEIGENYYDAILTASVDFLSKTDELQSMVLVSHLLCEFWINHMIDVCFPYPNKIISVKSFDLKVKIIRAAGLIDKILYNNLHITNSMRNSIAHNLDIDENDLRQKLTRFHFLEEVDLSQMDIITVLGVTALDSIIKIKKIVENRARP